MGNCCTLQLSRFCNKNILLSLNILISVGIASETFGFNEAGEFYLIPGIVVEGITPTALSTYCNDLMFSGTCYKALNRISTPTSDIGKYKYEGFIFKVSEY